MVLSGGSDQFRPPEINPQSAQDQSFSADLLRHVFITTSTFSEAARIYAGKVIKKISLIDGPRLASLMIDFGVGVSKGTTYQLQYIDSYYFEEK